MTFLPTPKVATGGAAGILTTFIIYELTSRFHIVIAPEEAAFITTLVSFGFSFFAPKSDPTPAQKASIIQDHMDSLSPNPPTTPL